MSDNVYSITEIAGSSSESVEAAIDNALNRARKTLRNLDWFEPPKCAATSARTGPSRTTKWR